MKDRWLFIGFSLIVDGAIVRVCRHAPAGTTFSDAWRAAHEEAARVGGSVRVRESGLADVAVLTFANEPGIDDWVIATPEDNALIQPKLPGV